MNELTRQGITFLEAGDESKAQKLFIESLHQNIRDAETWFWVATTFKDRADCARCLKYVIQLVDPSNEIAQKGLVYLSQEIGVVESTIDENLKPVEIPVAGVDHRNRQTMIRELRISERALLRREPYNPYDVNAIRVETENGQQFGYIPRKIASVLSPYIDGLQKLLPARVTGLTAGYQDHQSVSVKVTFFIPKHLQLPSGSYEYLEYFYDDSGSHTYVLLNCNEYVLENVKSELQKCEMRVLHSGVSSRPAPNGHLYQWFIRITDENKEEIAGKVERLFESVFGVLSDEAKVKRLEQEKLDLEVALRQAETDRDKLEEEKDKLENESIGYLYESDNLRDETRQKEARVEMLKCQLDQKQDELDSQKRAKRIQEASTSEPFREIGQIIKCLLPDIEFLRDSLEILLYEVQGYHQAIKKLHEISYRPETVRAENFECAPGFRELHFGKDGRIYFRRGTSEGIKVLVSTKHQQREDERYLKKYT